MSHRAIICRSCQAGRDGLAAILAKAFDGAGLPFEIAEADCMSGCARPSTIAFRAPGKTAYLFGDITEGDLPDLITFARLYLATTTGDLDDARALGNLRLKAIARIPG